MGGNSDGGIDGGQIVSRSDQARRPRRALRARRLGAASPTLGRQAREPQQLIRGSEPSSATAFDREQDAGQRRDAPTGSNAPLSRGSIAVSVARCGRCWAAVP